MQGERGVITGTKGKTLRITLVDGISVDAAPDSVTNFSLAARKAWNAMPERRVGRPKGSRTTDRVSVTLRIDRRLWEQFRKAEKDGAISDRTSLFNQCLREKLAQLGRSTDVQCEPE